MKAVFVGYLASQSYFIFLTLWLLEDAFRPNPFHCQALFQYFSHVTYIVICKGKQEKISTRAHHAVIFSTSWFC